MITAILSDEKNYLNINMHSLFGLNKGNMKHLRNLKQYYNTLLSGEGKILPDKINLC
jgi:hypothetical protein